MVKIPIMPSIEKEEKKYNYTGNENFFINQNNTNGALLDFGILYGKREYKIFCGFQIKCYSTFTSLDDKFLRRDLIQKELIKKIKLHIMLDIKLYYHQLKIKLNIYYLILVKKFFIHKI